jgi:hypothetical protein
MSAVWTELSYTSGPTNQWRAFVGAVVKGYTDSLEQWY